MAQAVHHGSITSRLERQPGGSIRYNTDGTVSAQERFIGLYQNAIQQSPKRYITAHPVFPNLICDEVEIKEIEGGRCEINATYYGPPVGLTNGGPDTQPTWELSCETSEEPIETFPNFGTAIGTAGNNAVFDDDGRFLGFKAISDFHGQESWLVPGQVYRKRYYSYSPPGASELARVGKIDTPDGWISTPGGRNWLLLALTAEQRGQIYTCTKSWRLSGPDGWKTEIYSPST